MKRFLLTVLCFLVCCSAQQAFGQVFSEDFENGLPADWAVQTNATDGGWNTGTNLGSQYFPIPAHTTYAATNDDDCNCNKSADILNLPVLDFSEVGAADLTFDYYFINGDYDADERAFVEFSTDGANWSTRELESTGDSWQTLSIPVAGASNVATVYIRFRYDDGGGWNYGYAIDNISIDEVETTVDIRVNGLQLDQVVVIGSYDLAGTIENIGGEMINSLDLLYSIDGGDAQVMTLTDLDLGYGETVDFTHESPMDLNADFAGSVHDVTLLAYNLNDGAVDVNQVDNSFSTEVGVVSNIPDKHVLIEENTGTWCGWCPRGTVALEQMTEDYPKAVLVAVHNGDPMTVNEWDSGLSEYVPGYPNGIVDRAITGDPGDFESMHNQRIGQHIPIASVGVNAYMNPDTREVTIDVTAVFELAFTVRDYRLGAMIIEDGVTGSGSGYNQANYYSGGGNGPMGGYENLPDPVPANQMVYDHVGRAILGGVWGDTNSLPDGLEVGTPYTHTFTYTLPAAWDENNIHIAGVLYMADDGSGNRGVENANKTILEIEDECSGFNIVVSHESSGTEEGTNEGTASVSVLDNDPADFTYVWSTNPIQVTPTAVNLTPGTYSVTITEIASGCEHVETVDVEAFAVGLNDLVAPGQQLGFCYPNPADIATTIAVDNINETMNLRVVDVSGKVVLNATVNTGAQFVQINMENLANGTYFYQLIDANRIVDTKKMIVLH